MSEEEFKMLLWLGAGCLGGIVLFAFGFIINHKKKLIENIPTSKIRSVALGLVEISGKAKAFGDVLTAPFAKKNCVYYKYKVAEERGSGKNRHWVTIAKEETQVPFFIEDETGQMMIFPDGSEQHLHVDDNYHNGFLGNAANRSTFIQGLNDIGIDPKGFLGTRRKLRCEETYIEPDDYIYIMGTAQTNRLKEQSSHVGHENICIGKSGKQYFCISDHSEKVLLNKMRWQVIGCFLGGPVLAVGCLFGVLKLTNII